MSRRQFAERTDEISNFRIGGMDTDPSAELLQHVDPRPSVGRIHHEVHGSVRFEYAAESTEARIRVGEMVENARAHNLIKARPQVAHLVDGHLVDLKIFQVVFPLEFLRAADTRCAEVDAGYVSPRPAQRMLGSLRRSTAG